jgi:hypothetical protein
MAIRDKDGNVYKIRGPNPLVKNSDNWDKNKITLINFQTIKEETVEDKRKSQKTPIDIGKDLNLSQEPEESRVVPPQEFLNKINEPEPTEQPVEEPVQKDFKININVDERVARALLERGVEYFCSPVIGHKEIVDELYGTSYKTPKYGTKFLFDAIIIDQSDLQLQIWCVKELSKDSIVYRKNQQGGERWWRITEKEAKSGGYLCLATVSDVNPDFT